MLRVFSVTDAGRTYLWATLSYLVVGPSAGLLASWILVRNYEDGRLLLGLWFSIRLTALVWGLVVPGALLGWIVTAFALEAASSGRSSRGRWFAEFLITTTVFAIAVSTLFGSSMWLFSLLLGFKQEFLRVVLWHAITLISITMVFGVLLALFERYLRPQLVPRPANTRLTSLLFFLLLVPLVFGISWSARRDLALEELPRGGWVVARRSAPFTGVGSESGARLTNYMYAEDWIVRIDIDLDNDGKPECIKRGSRLSVISTGDVVETPSSSCRDALHAVQ